MKKYILVIILALIFILTLSSCDEQAKNNENSVAVTTSSAPAESLSPSDSTPQGSQNHVCVYGKWETVIEAACEKDGKKERSCTCGSKEIETIAALSHKYVNGACLHCKVAEPDHFVSDYKSGEANTLGNESGNSRYASQGNWIYFSTSVSQISKIKKDGSSLTPVYKVSNGTVQNINVVGDWIYFYCEGNTEAKSYIAKVRTDGSKFEKIVNSLYVWDLLVVKDTVFFTKYSYGTDDYAKNWYTLYSVSVNGGITTQIHDGIVSSIAADSSYIYYLYENESGKNYIYRMKHDGTKKTEIFSKISGDIFDLDSYTNYFTLKNSKLYFIVFDQWKEEYYIASISTNGGSYTTYDTCFLYPSDFLYIVGNKAYYYGEPCKWDASGETFSETAGLVEYDMANKTYKLIMEEYETYYFHFTSELIIYENYKDEALTSLTVYNTKNGSFKEFKIK